ncbi:MAG: hypothetical protein K2K90_09670 [Lachnospiraceae bacterium]|nr:hypothetical protein [Lachnospiraceae bacterium]
MPGAVKDVKYPSKNAPDLVVTSMDSAVNFGFNLFNKRIEACVLRLRGIRQSYVGYRKPRAVSNEQRERARQI